MLFGYSQYNSDRREARIHPQDVTRVLSNPLAQELMQSSIPARLAYLGPDGFPRAIPIGFHWNGIQFVRFGAGIRSSYWVCLRPTHWAGWWSSRVVTAHWGTYSYLVNAAFVLIACWFLWTHHPRRSRAEFHPKFGVTEHWNTFPFLECGTRRPHLGVLSTRRDRHALREEAPPSNPDRG